MYWVQTNLEGFTLKYLYLTESVCIATAWYVGNLCSPYRVAIYSRLGPSLLLEESILFTMNSYIT